MTTSAAAAARRVLIVGGVAGGASVAARARRLSEDAHIIMFERGPHVSFANCGLPYYLGGEIAEAGKLLVQTPEGLRSRFNLDVRTRTEVLSIDRTNRKLRLRDLEQNREYEEAYDDLVLSTGAAPLVPPIPGIDRPGHFTLRNVVDTLAIDQWIKDHQAQRAVVVGGGYIGLEMAEQLHRRGLKVSIAEALPQVMAPLDSEMAAYLHQTLRDHGIELHLGDAVAGFEADPSVAASVVKLKSGAALPGDVVILGLGVRPESKLARDAGLELGERGGIRVDEYLRTSDEHIYAIGDAIEVRNRITGQWSMVPLAGPANRQGRIVADNLLGKARTYPGTLGTAALRLFELTAGCTGANERLLQQAKLPYQAVHLHPGHHVGYYPGAKPIAMKLLFDPGSGRIYGAQAVGEAGVDKRIDVIATAMLADMTVEELAELELAYAPPFGAAKDPVNLAGMAAQNIRDGLVEVVQWHEVAQLGANVQILDVRDPGERQRGAIPGSMHIPLPELRDRLGELPRDKELLVHCQSGQRSYYACRLLSQRGFRCRNLTGSYKTWQTATSGKGN